MEGAFANQHRMNMLNLLLATLLVVCILFYSSPNGSPGDIRDRLPAWGRRARLSQSAVPIIFIHVEQDRADSVESFEAPVALECSSARCSPGRACVEVEAGQPRCIAVEELQQRQATADAAGGVLKRLQLQSDGQPSHLSVVGARRPARKAEQLRSAGSRRDALQPTLAGVVAASDKHRHILT